MTGRGQKVSYAKPSEPAFLKQMKEKLGYRQPATIDSKREELDDDAEESEEKEDFEAEKEEDRPQIVVIKSGDLSQDDVDQIIKDKRLDEEKDMIEKGKITFKKPIKRTADSNDKTEETSKRKKDDWADEQIKSRLLSFQDDEEDD